MASHMKIIMEKATPPEPTRGPKSPGVWKTRLAPLMEEPGEWFLVAQSTFKSMSNTSWALRNGGQEVPEGEWEFTVRKATNEDGQEVGNLFARYVGPEGAT